jgi:hypothetical protein
MGEIARWRAATSAGRCRGCCRRPSSRRLTAVCRAAALESSQVYFPYFAIGTVFDNAATRARLEPAGIHASPLHDYLERLLDFATRSRWGKRPIARAEALRDALGSVAGDARAGQTRGVWRALPPRRSQTSLVARRRSSRAVRCACPICDEVEWTACADGYDPSVQCLCRPCDERWRVYLAPQQALR